MSTKTWIEIAEIAEIAERTAETMDEFDDNGITADGMARFLEAAEAPEGVPTFEGVKFPYHNVPSHYTTHGQEYTGWTSRGYALARDEATAQSVMAACIEEALDDDDVAAWHDGEPTTHVEELIETYGPFSVWGSRTGSEPLHVSIES